MWSSFIVAFSDLSLIVWEKQMEVHSSNGSYWSQPSYFQSCSGVPACPDRSFLILEHYGAPVRLILWSWETHHRLQLRQDNAITFCFPWWLFHLSLDSTQRIYCSSETFRDQQISCPLHWSSEAIDSHYSCAFSAKAFFITMTIITLLHLSQCSIHWRKPSKRYPDHFGYYHTSESGLSFIRSIFPARTTKSSRALSFFWTS